MAKQQLSLEQSFSKEELIALCHSRIPEVRHIVGYLDSNLIAPLPIWSPVPEKYQRTARDRFHIWGLEAQHPKYLPETLKPFVYVVCSGKGRKKDCFLRLREGAYKKDGVSHGENE